MQDIKTLVDNLMNSDDKKAYKCLQQLETESINSNIVYPFFNVFVNMLGSPNSYIRTRGIILIASNAKWDTDYKIDEVIDKYLLHISDDKPITARQCINVLPLIAKYKPDLKQLIENSLHRANVGKYKDSMQSLIIKDIQKALEEIKNI